MKENKFPSWEEMKAIKVKEGDIVVIVEQMYVALKHPESGDDSIVIEQDLKRKMSYPSQAIYKPRKK